MYNKRGSEHKEQAVWRKTQDTQTRQKFGGVHAQSEKHIFSDKGDWRDMGWTIQTCYVSIAQKDIFDLNRDMSHIMK